MKSKEVEKDYRKANVVDVEEVRVEHTVLADKLGIKDRIFGTARRESFVTLKDHKVDFRQKPTVRLLNPTKNELGRVAMRELAKLIKEVKEITNLNQCVSTRDVVKWFKDLGEKKSLKFVTFDIVSFYPAITLELFNKALDWAGGHVEVTVALREIYVKYCQSFLYSGGVPWVKKGNVNFDVGMGAYQGAQVCEIVGLFILHKLGGVEGLDCLLYRDDGLGVTRKTARQQVQLATDIRKVFSDEGLMITISMNLASVDFLDVNCSLKSRNFQALQESW